MESMLDRAGLKVSEPLVRFLEERALPGTGLSPDQFWQGTAQIFSALAPDPFPRRVWACARKLFFVCGIPLNLRRVAKSARRLSG